MAGALTGIRVLDLTSVVMGPMATQIRGDLGADVITVESAGGETNRVMGPGPHPALSGTSLNLLRSKRNIALDLKHPDGHDVLMRLAATCDVFVTNLRPSSLGRLRLTYDEVRCARPDVVYCQAQGFPAAASAHECTAAPQADEPSAMSFAVGSVYLLDAVSQDVRRTMEGCLMEITNLGRADGLPPVDWAAVADKLDAGSEPAADGANSRTTWLSTVNEDGSPHVTAVGALWLDGTFWFQTGAGTRKGRNVARDPRCSIAVSIRDADVVFEGDAVRVTEPGALARIAKAWGG